MKKLFKFKLIMDAHNEGVVPYVNDNRLFVMLTNYTHKASDLVIVTNENLLKIVEINGGNGFVLPDSLPAVPTETERQRFDKNALAITVINTFAKDEPLQEILDAVAQLGRDVRVFVTGNYKGSSKQDLTTAPDIVTFTGFLSEERYWERLVNSDIIIDLTSMKDCLVCGSYEAIAAGVPVLLSDDASARKLFTKGVVFTRNDAESIRENLRFAVSELEKLTEEIKELKLEYQSFWTSRAVEMKAHLTSRENNQR